MRSCPRGEYTTHQIRGDVVVVPDDDFAARAAPVSVDMNKAWPFPDLARAAAAVDSEGGEV